MKIWETDPSITFHPDYIENSADLTGPLATFLSGQSLTEILQFLIRSCDTYKPNNRDTTGKMAIAALYNFVVSSRDTKATWWEELAEGHIAVLRHKVINAIQVKSAFDAQNKRVEACRNYKDRVDRLWGECWHDKLGEVMLASGAWKRDWLMLLGQLAERKTIEEARKLLEDTLRERGEDAKALEHKDLLNLKGKVKKWPLRKLSKGDEETVTDKEEEETLEGKPKDKQTRPPTQHRGTTDSSNGDNGGTNANNNDDDNMEAEDDKVPSDNDDHPDISLPQIDNSIEKSKRHARTAPAVNRTSSDKHRRVSQSTSTRIDKRPRFDKHKQHAKKYKHQAKKYKRRYKDLEEQNSAATFTISALRDQLEDPSRGNRKLIACLTRERDEAVARAEHEKRQTADLSTQLSAMAKERNSMMQQLANPEDQRLRDANVAREQQKMQIQTLEARVGDLNDTIDNLNDTVENLTDTVENYNASAKEINAKVNELNAKVKRRV